MKLRHTFVSQAYINSCMILFTVLFIASCDNSSDGISTICCPDTTTVCPDTTRIPNLNNWLIPLTVGNSWTYRLESHFGDDTIPIFTSSTTQIILGNTQAFLKCKMFNAVIYDRGTTSDEKWVYWQDSTGYYSLGGFSNSDTLKDKVLKYQYQSSSTSGIIRFLTKPGELVKKGQPVARIYNAFGRLQETITALNDSIVLGHSDYSVSFPGTSVMSFGNF